MSLSYSFLDFLHLPELLDPQKLILDNIALVASEIM